MQPSTLIRLGTRQSKLALAQAELVKAALNQALPDIRIEIISMLTTGDNAVNHPLSEIGGKGLFTKELEEGLLDRTLDIAVHSLKDMPTQLPKGLTISAVLPREDARDALLSNCADSLETLPSNPIIGTSSLRRAVLVKSIRPDAVIVPFRGNVPTRIDKIKRGEVHASLLAQAGLNRLNLAVEAQCQLDPRVFIPAVGQGAICIECRKSDAPLMELLNNINDIGTYYATLSERAMLEILDGSCKTPIGGYATVEQNQLHLRAFVASPDGLTVWRTQRIGDVSDANAIGIDAARELKSHMGK